jgi:rhodanese-related sulfurtransferase
MRKKIMAILMVFTSLTLAACQSNSVEEIDADKALEFIAENPEIVLLDVREYSEYVTERIEGSELLPLSIIETALGNAYPDKDTTFIVYCRSGRRSAEAIQIMLDAGYENLYDLGGIIDWPYETVSGTPN